MKVSKKVIPYAVMTSLAVSAVVAPAAAADAQAQYEAGFYIEKDGVLQYYNAVEFGLLSDSEKEGYVLDADQFVFVHQNGTAASVDAIFEARSVNAALAPVTAGLIKDGSYTTKSGEVKEVTEPVAVDPDPTDVTSEPVDPDPTDVVDPDPDGDLAVESVSAINVNKLQVTFNQPVDTDDVTLAITRGGRTVPFTEQDWNADNTVVTITTTANMVAGTHTVTVTSPGEAIATGSVEVKDQQVAEIVILNDVALTNDDSTEAYVYYDVLDQYGESLRMSTSLQWSSSADDQPADRAKGLLKIERTGGTAFSFGEKIYVTAVHARTGVSTTKTVEVGMKQALDSIEVKGFLNRSTNEVVEQLPAGFREGEYELLFNALDQNGNPLEDESNLHQQITFTSSNPLVIARIDSGVSELRTGVIYEGEEYIGAPVVPGNNVSQGGEVTITVVANNTGNRSTINAFVGESVILSSFTMSNPTDMIADGENVEIPFTALDQDGNQITNFHILATQQSFNQLNFSASIGELRLEQRNDGTARLMFRDNGSNDWTDTHTTDGIDRMASLTSVVVGGNTSGIMVSIQDKARPVGIASVDMNRVFVEGGSQTLNYSDMKFVDQYGRTMSGHNSFFNHAFASGRGEEFSNSRFYVRATLRGDIDFAGFSANSDGENRLLNFTGSDETVTANPDVTSTSVTGQHSLRFEIVRHETSDEVNVVSPARTVSLSIVDISAVRNFEIEELNKFKVITDNSANATGLGIQSSMDTIAVDTTQGIYATDSAYQQEVKLNGLFNGQKVSIPNTYFTVEADKLQTGPTPTTGDSTFIEVTSNLKYSDLYDVTTANFLRKDAKDTVTVKIYGNDGELLDTATRAITISDAPSRATKIDGDAKELTMRPTNTHINRVDNIDPFSTRLFREDSGTITIANNSDYEFVVKDQYGVVLDSITVTFTVSSVEENPAGYAKNNFAVVGNGTDDMRIEGAEVGDTFKLTMTATYVNAQTQTSRVSHQVTVTVGADFNAYITSGGDGNQYLDVLINGAGNLETQRIQGL